MTDTTIAAPGLALTRPTGMFKPRASLTPILLRYWWMILRWKWLIAGIIVGFVLLGLVVTLSMAPKFTATTQIEISRVQTNVTNVEGVQPIDRSRDVEFYQTQYSLLEARTLAERVARQLNLANTPDFFANHGVEARQGNTPAARAARARQVITLLERNIGISPVRGSSLVNVSYTSRSAEMSARVANAWVRQFVDSTLERRFASTADARSFLERRLQTMRQRLEASERALTNYSVDKGIVRLSTTEGPDGRTQTQRTLVSSDLEALAGALNAATAQRLEAESALAAARASGASTQSVTNLAVSQLRQRRAEAAAELARNLVQFEPQYPANRALREQVATLDTAIAREEGRVSSSLQATYQQAVGREQGLQARVNALRSQLDTQERDSIQLGILQREADTNRALYDGLLQRYKEIGVAGIASNDITIVDPALPPQRPSSPNLPLNLALAFLAGLVVAGVAAQALDQIDEGVRSASQVSEELDLPLLGSVPFINNLEIHDSMLDPKSTISEAFLTARSALALTTEHGVPRSLSVTSTRPAEGKSSSALGIAASLAKSGRRAILIDADMRKPSQHNALGLPNAHGLSNVLAGDDDWRRFVTATDLGVDVMTSGQRPPSAAELLSSDRLQKFVAELLGQYDHVVIDSPPMLGLADAGLIGAVVEGTIYVIEAEGAPLRGIRTSLERLRAANVHIIGALVTKLKLRKGGYGYGYGYDYDYGYGREDGDGTGGGSRREPASVARLGGGNLRDRLAELHQRRGGPRT